jgi:RND superfamily putative drug exporter
VGGQRAQQRRVPLTLAAGEDGEGQIAPVLDELAVLAPDFPDLRVEGVGGESIGHGIDATVNEDLGSAGLLSLPVTLAILLVVFGALFAAGVPLLLAFSSVAAATGLWAFVSQVVPDIGSVQSLILLIGLAVGVDYSLFYLRREREERARGHGTVDAVRIAAATSGRAVAVSALTSMVALAGVYLVGDGIFAALGTGVILAVAVAMVGSLTVLPALLVKLGRAMDRPRVPLLWRLTNRRDHGEQPRLWPALLAPALRAPRTTPALTLAVLVALALPALGMSLKNSTADDLPRTIPVVRAFDRLVAAFPGEGEAHKVVVRAPAGQAGEVRAALDGMVGAMAGDPLFAVDPPPRVRTSPDGTVSTLEVGYPYAYGAPEAEASLSALRHELVPAAVGGIDGVEHAVGGDLAESLDYTDRQVQRLPWVIGFVVLLTVAMMAVGVPFTGGGRAGRPAQRGVGRGRVRGAHAGVPGHERGGGDGRGLRDLRHNVVAGDAAARVGLSAAIAIDATIVRIPLLPAVMNLLGQANWWPSKLSRAGRRAPAATAPVPTALVARD